MCGEDCVVCDGVCYVYVCYFVVWYYDLFVVDFECVGIGDLLFVCCVVVCFWLVGWCG